MPGTEPPRSATAANDEADRLIARGNAEEDAGRLAEAIACYRQAIAAAPLHARAHLDLGIGLEAGGDGDAAVGAFDRAIALEPSNARAASDLAALLGARGEWDDADRWVRAALEREPDDPEAHFALSDILDAKGGPRPPPRPRRLPADVARVVPWGPPRNDASGALAPRRRRGKMDAAIPAGALP